MAVEVFRERFAPVLKWEKGEYEGPVTLQCVNTADLSDISSTEYAANTGFGAVTFPLGYTGEFKATVLDPDGNVIDEGVVGVE